MSDAPCQALVSYTELLARGIAVDGTETITVSLWAPVVAHVTAASKLRGCTPDEWLLQAIVERAHREGIEAQRDLEHLRESQRRADVRRDADVTTSPVVNAVDGVAKARITAADAVGDDLEVDRLLTRHVAFKRQIADLSPIERDVVAEQMLRELLSEIVP